MDTRYSVVCSDNSIIYSSFLHEKFRIVLTRWRLSSIDINIENGRHQNIPRHERLCNHCTLNEIEDERHVIFICPLYNNLQTAYNIPSRYLSVKMILNQKTIDEASNVARYLMEIENTCKTIS